MRGHTRLVAGLHLVGTLTTFPFLASLFSRAKPAPAVGAGGQGRSCPKGSFLRVLVYEV